MGKGDTLKEKNGVGIINIKAGQNYMVESYDSIKPGGRVSIKSCIALSSNQNQDRTQTPQ